MKGDKCNWSVAHILCSWYFVCVWYWSEKFSKRNIKHSNDYASMWLACIKECPFWLWRKITHHQFVINHLIKTNCVGLPYKLSSPYDHDQNQTKMSAFLLFLPKFTEQFQRLSAERKRHKFQLFFVHLIFYGRKEETFMEFFWMSRCS